jgi:hypothetical protein
MRGLTGSNLDSSRWHPTDRALVIEVLRKPQPILALTCLDRELVALVLNLHPPLAPLLTTILRHRYHLRMQGILGYLP